MKNEAVSEAHDQVIDRPAVKEVPMKGWEASDETHAILFTHGLGPCIGLTAYDPVTKKGFMGHIANPALEKTTLDQMVAAIRGAVDNPARLRVWVRGGQVDQAMVDAAQRGEGIDFFQMGRDVIADYIDSLVGPNHDLVDVQYDTAPMSSGAATMQRLDTETGDFISEGYTTQEYRVVLGALPLGDMVRGQSPGVS